jgi:hypothetical protein
MKTIMASFVLLSFLGCDDSPSTSKSNAHSLVPPREESAARLCQMVANQNGAEVLAFDKIDQGKEGVMVNMTIKTAEPRRYKARCLFTDNDGSGKIRADIVDTTEEQ